MGGRRSTAVKAQLAVGDVKLKVLGLLLHLAHEVLELGVHPVAQRALALLLLEL